MRTSAWVMILGLAGFAVACGDQPTEVVPDREGGRAGGGRIALATSSSDDGLSITTDRDDYAPGDTVWFVGAGWLGGDTLDIELVDDPLTHSPHTWWIPVAGDGTFRDSTYVVDEGDVGVTFTLIATSRTDPTKQLTVVFTDGRDILSVSLNGGTTATVAPSAVITATVTGQLNGNGNNTLGSIGVKAHLDGTAASTAVSLTCFDVNPDQGPSSPSTPIPYTHTFTFTAPAATGAYDVIVSSYSDNVCATTMGTFSFPIDKGITVQLANQAPNQPSSLGQFKLDGTTAIAVGGATNENSVVLKGTLSDPNAANTVRLQVEAQLVGTAFTNTPSATSSAVASGNVASATVSGLADGNYHWQARAIDNSDVAGPWLSFGSGNPESATDFQVKTGKPSVTINQAAAQADPTNAATINFTATFSEDVAGFATGDVTLSGTAGATTAVVTGGPKIFNVAVSGMTADGTVIADIAADVATDGAGNGNTASTSTDKTVTYDGTPPTVTINQAMGQADPTNASPINFTVEFSEVVTDFATGDVTLSGTAGATTGTVTGSGTTYNVAVSGMTGSGTVIASIAAGVAHDAATNGNLASTSTDHTVTYDNEPPVVSSVAVSPSPTNGTVSVNATATVSDATTGNSKITSAGYSIDGGTTVAMAATDNAFDEVTEGVKATVSAGVIAALENGSHTLCVQGTDAAGNTSLFTAVNACATFIVDKVPPVVSTVAASPNPTDGSVAVTLSANISDASTGNSDIVGAAYSVDGGSAVAMAATDGTFDSPSEGVTATIGAGLSEGSHTLCVQGEDAAGNTSSFAAANACTTLIVDKTPPAISNFTVTPNPVAVNTNFTISAKFTDALTDVAGAEYSLTGSGGPWINLAAADGLYDSGTETGTATISKPNADVLDVCVRGSDEVGNTNPTTGTNPIQCIFLAIYDPSAGFVTGGGWIISPTGAYVPDPTLTGKATFGFVSKYLKGANVPTGNTEFQFHAAGMNFSSGTYEWLVVSGNGQRAQYKGTGTINGQGGYSFLLTAVDQTSDQIRMKIWVTATNAIVYDNRMGSPDSGNDATPLGGGSVMIQVPKK